MKVGVIIPSYRVKGQVLSVIEKIGSEISKIYVVDDCCPEGSGKYVEEHCRDARVRVLYHQKNQGVGGAMVTGYREAINDALDIAVKIDGDGQMDPCTIPNLIQPIINGQADYTKGNRFFNLESLKQMPLMRLFGNSVLSFVSKAASGYWNLMDPTNGFTAIHVSVLKMLPLEKLDRGYFFESGVLFRLNTVRAVIRELPMDACYGDEKSSLNIGRVCLDFPGKYLRRFIKRIFYNYYLRDFNACSLELALGVFLLCFGAIYGAVNWYWGSVNNAPNPLGTVMIAALSVIMGFQLLLSAVQHDLNNIPKEPLHLVIRS